MTTDLETRVTAALRTGSGSVPFERDRLLAGARERARASTTRRYAAWTAGLAASVALVGGTTLGLGLLGPSGSDASRVGAYNRASSPGGTRSTMAATPTDSYHPSRPHVPSRIDASYIPSLGYGSCGEVRLTQGERVGVPAARECLDAAVRDHRGAQWSVTAPTTEGDPVTTWLVVHPDGRLQTVIDSTKDAFGPQAWTSTLCPSGQSVQQCWGAVLWLVEG